MKFNTLLLGFCLIVLLAWQSFQFSTQRTAQTLSNNPTPILLKDNQIALNRYKTGKEYLNITKASKIDLENKHKVEFDIKWDASWNDYENHDAAWIFVKGKDNKGNWKHLRIISNSAKMIENWSSDGAQPDFEEADDQMGIFIYRQEQSEGNNHWRLKMELDLAETEDYSEIKIFGLEMVYVPTGAFELGTLKSIRQRREVLTPGAGGAPYNPFFSYNQNAKDKYGGVYKINSETPIDIGKKDGNLFWVDANIPGTNTFSGIPDGQLKRSFPKGFNGFYQMKYELSQAQYCDFLNYLSPNQQQARDISTQIEYKRPVSDYRNAIQKEGGIFKTDRPNRPCNFISWLDGQAYADWAGLRHMTELEFEKACRGPLPAVYREYVWGANEIREKDNMVYAERILEPSGELATAELGQEIIEGNIHASMFSYFNYEDVCLPGSRFYDPDCLGCRAFKGGDGGKGPLRMGICGVTSNGNRVKAGATYYGAMDMGGNLQEPVVTVGHPSGRKFEGSHGDGGLDENGQSTNSDWQPIDQDYAFGGRGGCWKFHENHARIADRFKGLRTRPNRRASHIGFRGVRSAD